MKLDKRDLYISNAINSKSNCVSWRKWLACGMTQSVVLVDQSNINANLRHQFTEHKSIVTCVSWISDDLLVSADDSANIIIWKIDSSIGNLLSFNKHKLSGNIGSIVALHGLQTEFGIYIACSFESYMDLIMFDGDFHSIHHITSEPCFIISVNLLDIYGSIMISLGLDDGRVLCYLVDINTDNISPPLVLTGHEDWITALNSIKCMSHSSQIAYLASSSQDSFIRVWKISPVSLSKENNNSNQLDVQKLELTGNIGLYICLDGVLAGHENWVTSINWCQRERSRGGLMLASTSMDKSVIVWSQDGDEDGQWIEETRLGQIGGNTLGFIGGSINLDGNMIIGFGYQGDCVVYYYDESDARWNTVVNTGGHFDVVEDIAWENESGQYLISVSKDQTVRLHAAWVKNDGGCDWQEIARPQIHGFDMTSVASIDSVTFITGADEKISRVFGMNKLFNGYFQQICRSRFDTARCREDLVCSDALGLSNKSVSGDGDGDGDALLSPGTSHAVPKEENICGHTLWPEITKLYGHVYEVFRISCHAGRKLVATTCKALVPEYADIILWNTESWTIVQRLPFHKSTVVRVQFNRNGDRIVSVSKDRQWALWKDVGGSEINFQLVNHSKKPHCHSKIIWDVDWSRDDRCFATVSRDKKMILWDSENGLQIADALVFKESVNAISTMPVTKENFYIFAVGLENGEIEIVQFDFIAKSWSILLSFIAHYDWITRLRFNPCFDDKNKYLLASCSKDRFVKIFEITIAE